MCIRYVYDTYVYQTYVYPLFNTYVHAAMPLCDTYAYADVPLCDTHVGEAMQREALVTHICMRLCVIHLCMHSVTHICMRLCNVRYRLIHIRVTERHSCIHICVTHT